VAKKQVQEPPQQKIKLKVTASEPTPKIMLRMGGAKNESPMDTPTPPSGVAHGIKLKHGDVDGTKDPTPSVKGEAVNSPAKAPVGLVKVDAKPSPTDNTALTASATAAAGALVPSPSPGTQANGTANTAPIPQPLPPKVWDLRNRFPGKREIPLLHLL
jgi:hypothetical protein